MSAELRRLVPGTTTANNPIRDEAIWKIAESGEVGQWRHIAIADEALKLAIHFVDAWASVNPPGPPIAFKPRPPIVPGPPPQSNQPEIVLLHETIRRSIRGRWTASTTCMQANARWWRNNCRISRLPVKRFWNASTDRPSATVRNPHKGSHGLQLLVSGSTAGYFEIHAIDLRSSVYEAGANFPHEVPFDGGRRRAIVPSALGYGPAGKFPRSGAGFDKVAIGPQSHRGFTRLPCLEKIPARFKGRLSEYLLHEYKPGTNGYTQTKIASYTLTLVSIDGEQSDHRGERADYRGEANRR